LAGIFGNILMVELLKAFFLLKKSILVFNFEDHCFDRMLLAGEVSEKMIFSSH